MKILVIEDNDIDVERVERILGKQQIPASIIHAPHGEAALQQLLGRSEDEPGDVVDLILLDLNMPRMSGAEFLRAFRGDASLPRTPVYVLSTSDRHRDVYDAITLGADGYLLKPLGATDLMRVLGEIERRGAPAEACEAAPF